MISKATVDNRNERIKKQELLYSWRFFCDSAPIHWLVHGQMTSNNDTVSHPMLWVGNLAKTVTSNRKQFTVTGEMLTAVARDLSVQLKVAWCRRNLSAFFKMCFFLYCHIAKHSMIGPLGNSQFSFLRISMFQRLRFSRNETHCFPRDQSLGVKYFSHRRFGYDDHHRVCWSTRHH